MTLNIRKRAIKGFARMLGLSVIVIDLSNQVLFRWDDDTETSHALRRKLLGRMRTLTPLEGNQP